MNRKKDARLKKESQDPDLNRSVVDLQSTAWPLRHLGTFLTLIFQRPEIKTITICIPNPGRMQGYMTREDMAVSRPLGGKKKNWFKPVC